MAAAVDVDASTLLDFVDGILGRLWSPDVAANLVKENKLDDMFLHRLETTLCEVEDMLHYVDHEQIQSPALKKWLHHIKDAVYVTDGLLNRVATKSEPAEEVSMLKGIIHRLESILEHKDFLGLKQISRASLFPEHIIYGRDNDRDHIIELLLHDYDASDISKISVIPIVGKGGVGKTTLAKLVYNDKIVEQNFDFKAWVSVGGEFNILNITKIIIEEVTSSTCNMDQDLNSLQLHLKEKLSGKKFLLVLDDIWNENYADWSIFISPFQYEMKGGKVLVTTRSRWAASFMRTSPPFLLRDLSDEDCWTVFAKQTSLSSRSSITSTREKIGREIVCKCKGLPLAVQTIGGLLRTEHNIRHWNTILKSDIWKFLENENDVIPALEISYHYLPAHLKRCLTYCSLYPKYYKFNRHELILMWMAQGLLPSSNNKKMLEDIGHEYFHELVYRSFLQDSGPCDSYRSFVMHDLIHDFVVSKAHELRTFLPLNFKEELSARMPSASWGTSWIQIHPFPSLTLPTVSSASIVQHQWMISLRIWNLRLRISLWRLMGLVSGVIGMSCLALSPSFSHLIGGWDSFKFFLFGVVIFIICITTMFVKKCTFSRRDKLKAHMGFAVLMLTSMYSFWYDKVMNAKPDLWSMISNGAFAFMSLSLSRVLRLGFEVGAFAFFLGSFMIQLATIKLMLIPVAMIFGYPLYLIHSYSNADSDDVPSMRILDE